MKPTCVYRLFVLLWSILVAVMIGTTASTGDPSPVFQVLFGGLMITFGVYLVRHKHEVAQAQIMWPRAFNRPGYLGFMGVWAIFVGAMLVAAWAFGAAR